MQTRKSPAQSLSHQQSTHAQTRPDIKLLMGRSKTKSANTRGSHGRQDLALDSQRSRDDDAQRVRASRESRLSFGTCGLSLQPLEDPVATPSGHVYSREALLEHILARKRALKRQQRAIASNRS